jgi:hypothetical protein
MRQALLLDEQLLQPPPAVIVTSLQQAAPCHCTSPLLILQLQQLLLS